MHPQYAAVGLVQPSQQDDIVASSNAVEANLDLGIQDQVGVRRALITLPRRVGRRSERTLHVSYRADCEVDLGGVGHGGTQSQLRCRENQKSWQIMDVWRSNTSVCQHFLVMAPKGPVLKDRPRKRCSPRPIQAMSRVPREGPGAATIGARFTRLVSPSRRYQIR